MFSKTLLCNKNLLIKQILLSKTIEQRHTCNSVGGRNPGSVSGDNVGAVEVVEYVTVGHPQSLHHGHLLI